MGKISVETGLVYISEKGKRRKVLHIHPAKTNKVVYYLGHHRTRAEDVQDVVRMINKRLGRTSDWLPHDWNLTQNDQILHVFSCSERSFGKWLGNGTKESPKVSGTKLGETSHQFAQAMLALPDLPLVHPGIAGDIYVGVVYHDPEDEVIVVSDRVEASAGSEDGRHADAMRHERERCLQLIEARCQRLHKVIKDYPSDHPTHRNIAASIENLRAVEKWISGGRTPKDTTKLNPGGST